MFLPLRHCFSLRVVLFFALCGSTTWCIFYLFGGVGMVKSDSRQELLFKTLVTDLIRCKDIRMKEKEYRLVNFWNQPEFYYDVFCESIYMLMTDDSVDTLSIDDSGYSRFDIIVLADDFYPGFELLTKEDIRPDVDDLIVYVDIALSRLRNRLKQHCSAGARTDVQLYGEWPAVN